MFLEDNIKPLSKCQQDNLKIPKGISLRNIVLCMKANFSVWLKAEMDQRDWNAVDLAREMGGQTTPATVYRILNEQRGVSDDVCRRIADALNLPQVAVFYQAGLLTEKPGEEEPTDERLKQIARRVGKLTDNKVDQLEEYISFLEQAEGKGKKNEAAKKVSSTHGANK